MESNKWTVAYVRISEEDLDKDVKYSMSIYNQINLIRSYAKNMGLVIDKEYIDDGYTGINFDRPGFEKLKDDIDRGKIGIVITKDMSRLGREFIDTAYYISEYFPSNNVRFIAINDEYDSNDEDNPIKDITIGIRSIINDSYVKDSSVKRKQVAEYKTANGEFIGFTAPYGYKIVKKDNKRTLEIDDEAADIVKRIFFAKAGGKTRNEIAEELNKDKVLPPIIYMRMTPSKNKTYYYNWSDEIVYRILKNKTYTGRIVERKSEKNNYKQKKRIIIPIRDRKTIDNTHPAIISDSLFEEANSKIKTLKRREKNNYDGNFSGMVICGECGKIMTACRKRHDSGKEVYYFGFKKVVNGKKCKNRVIYDNRLKTIINDTLNEIINTYANDDIIINSMTKELRQKERLNTKIINLRQSIEFHNTRIKELYIKKTKGEINLDEFIKLKNEQIRSKNLCEKELTSMIDSNNIEIRHAQVKDYYKQFMNDNILLKDYIRDIIEKIIVHKDNTLEIVFKFCVSNTKKIKLY